MLLVESLLGSSSAESAFIEDVFSTYLYTGNGGAQTISNGINTSDRILESLYVAAGTYTWVAPVGVTSVCAVAIGGDSTDSYFINTSTVRGGAPSGSTGGTYTGDGGGNGGEGGLQASNASGFFAYGGAGGAGGYSGNGGAGGNALGDAGVSANRGGGAGGGVGILGEGLSGTGGTRLGGNGSGGGGGGGGGASGNTVGTAGTGGSGGTSGSGGTPGKYGGGRPTTIQFALRQSGGSGLGWKNNIAVTPGASYTVVVGANNGAVRIIWGAGRSFPTNAAPVTSPNAALVWMKQRSLGNSDHALYDTVRGATFDLASNLTTGQTTQSAGLTDFISDGFILGGLAKTNSSGRTYASWTFRKQPRFFDIVTYTGNGSFTHDVAHNLGAVPGFIIIKATNSTGNWYVAVRSTAGSGWYRSSSTSDFGLNLTNSTNNLVAGTPFTTSTVLVNSMVGNGGTDAAQRDKVNANGVTYVMYLFANNAGGFGETGADNVISCGNYTGNGSATGPVVTLGWEPQWLLIKRIDGTGNWNIIDNMRGFVVGGTDAELNPNLALAESDGTFVTPTASGFQLNTTNTDYNNSGSNYLYMAIRRGPMRTPTSGASVYQAIGRTGTDNIATVDPGITVDLSITSRYNSGAANGNGIVVFDRLRGANNYVLTTQTSAESTGGVSDLLTSFANQTGVTLGADRTYAYINATVNWINWYFRRVPGFFDVVCYTGDGTVNDVSHNLGVVPELIIGKRRNGTGDWPVYYATANGGVNPHQYAVYLNTTAAQTGPGNLYLFDQPTASRFRPAYGAMDTNGGTYVAYLFASCPGVSKVGSYTGTGATQTIDCGFSAGARFILIKRTDATSDWYVWDTARGIIAGNDPYLRLNSTAAEVTNTDWVDTAASGFELSNAAGNLVNTNGASYIFLAIA